MGPIIVYMADMSLSSTGRGAIWTKVYQDGQVGGSWAVSRPREDPAHGKQEFIIPPKLKTGYLYSQVSLTYIRSIDQLGFRIYLVRTEIIALHEAYGIGKAQ